MGGLILLALLVAAAKCSDLTDAWWWPSSTRPRGRGQTPDRRGGEVLTSTPPWPQVMPAGLPPFPGSGWEPDAPPPPLVVGRAVELLPSLWKRGQGAWVLERTGERWIAYRAEIVASGKRGVVAYRQRAARLPSSPATAPGVRTSSPAASPMPTLKQGAGMPPQAPVQAVRVIQEQLGVTPDGRFGPQTKAAVVAYQRARGLTPDGIVGPKTWNALLQRGA